MPCKYFKDGKESKLYTELYGYFDETAPEEKSAKRVYEILRDNKLVRLDRGNMYVVQGNSAATQIKELDRINSKYPGLLSYNFIKITKPNDYSPTNKLYGFAINESVLMQIPAEGEANANATYKTQYDIDHYMRTVGSPTSAFMNDYRLDEMARRENTSDQSRFSSMERENEERTQEKVANLKNAFSKAGISVNVISDTDLDVLGQVDPHEIGQPVTIRINPEMLGEDTVYHEFGHVYIDLLGADHPAIANAIDALRDTDLYKQVELKYPDLQGERLDKEVLATAIGLEGAKITRKNPTPLQVLLNKIFRAFSNMLNKLGIKSTPATAATLAQEMFANELRASEMIKPLSSYVQQSRGEERLNKIVTEAKVQTRQKLNEIKQMPEATEEQRVLKEKMQAEQELLEKTLTNIKKVEDLSKFVQYSAENLAQAESEYEALQIVAKQNPKEAATTTNANRMYQLKRAIDAMDVIKQLKDVVRVQKKKDTKTGRQRPQIDVDRFDTMEERIYDIVLRIEDLENAYERDIIPMTADFLGQYHNKNLDPLVQEQIDNVQEHRRWENQLDPSDRDYVELKRRHSEGFITDQELEDGTIAITVQQLKNNGMPSRQALIDELKAAYKDKSGFSFYLDPLVYSNDKALQLFAKLVDESNIKKNQLTLDFKADLNEAYTEFAAGQDEINVEALNEPLTEEVEIDAWDGNKKKKIKVLALVQPHDLAKYQQAEQDMLAKLDEKYSRPLRKNFETEEEYTAAKRKWRNYKSWETERSAWLTENTEPIPTWKEQLGKIERQIKTEEKHLKRAQKIGNEEAVVMGEAKIERLKKLKRENITPTGVPKGDWVQPKLSLYTNPKYTAIQADPRLKKYYDFVLKELRKGHDMVGKNRAHRNAWDSHSYLLPSIRKHDVDRAREQGLWTTLKDKVKEGFTLQETDDEFGHYNSLSGELEKRVPVYYTNIVESKDVSRDIGSSLYQFRHMAHNFQEKSKIVGQVMIMRDLMTNRETLQTNSSGTVMMNQIAETLGMKLPQRKDGEAWALKHLNEFIDSQVFGQKEIKAKLGKADLSKVANSLNTYTALNNLSFNFLQAVNQSVLDNMTNLQEGIAGEFYSAGDIAWAKSQYWSEGAALKDVGKFQPETKLGKAMEFFDALTEVTDREGQRLVGSKFRKAMDTGSLMVLQQAAEHEMAATRMLALLHATKAKDANGNPILNEQGKPADLYDMLIIDEKGRMSMDPRVANANQSDVIHQLRGIARRTNQTKGSFDSSMLERRWYGRLFMLFRRYAVPGIRRRFGHMDTIHADEEMGVLTQGMYRTTAGMIMEAWRKGTPNLASIYDVMTDMEKQNVKRTAVELSSIAVAAAIVAALSNLDDDDETWASNFMLYQAKRYQTEMMQWNPLFGYEDIIRMAKSPAATIRPLEGGLGILNQVLRYEIPHAVGFPIEDKRIHYQRKTGRFEKGDRKIRKQFEDMLPVLRGLEKSKAPEEATKWFTK